MLARVKAALRPFRAYRAARFGWHFATDPIFRRDYLFGWRQPANLFQFRSLTSLDRYPGIFGFVAEGLAAVPQPRLLSFGCATGEEVFSLRRRLPRATIKGLDINPANIATCRTRLRAAPDPALAFEVNSTVAAEAPASYDAVFALAVFQRPQLKLDPAIATCAPFLDFRAFERAVTELAACVRPGGYLAIRHSMFRFADTACARDFTTVFRVAAEPTFFPRFGPDHRRLPDAPMEDAVFQKRPA